MDVMKKIDQMTNSGSTRPDGTVSVKSHSSSASSNEASTDITGNLISLKFESALTDEEKTHLNLRKRMHALTVSACAQAVYFTLVTNQIRQIRMQLSNPEERKATRLLQEAVTRKPFIIGIIGCGRLGSQLAHCLLTFGEIPPQDLRISTRRPETLADLREKGVTCIRNNCEVTKSADILFLCLLPSHVHEVANEIKGHLLEDTIVYSLIAAVPTARLRLLLGFSNILHAEFAWEKPIEPDEWDESSDVIGTFSKRVFLEKTCPLSLSEGHIVKTLDTFAEQLVYACVNLCSKGGIPAKETLDVVNSVLLGHSSDNPLQQKLRLKDIKTNMYSDKFPMFDLTKLAEQGDTLRERLVGNKHIRNAFVKQYCQLFQDYLDWKNQSLQIARKQIHFSFT